MGRAGKALRSVLEEYEISQNKLAVTLGIRRSIVFKWYHEERDPTAETVAEIVKALKILDPVAARAFIYRYLGQLMDEETAADE
jgi:predicted transcriptional regulator